MLSGKHRGAWKHSAEATLLGYRPGHKKVVQRANSSDVLKGGAKFLPPLAQVHMCKQQKIQQCSGFICIPKPLDYRTIQISIKWLIYPHLALIDIKYTFLLPVHE